MPGPRTGPRTGPRRSYVCGIDAAVDVIQGKWKVLILWALSQGHRRFGALRRELPGVSEKVLAAQLRELESDGIVHRRTYEEVPPRVEYSLTEFGASLNEALAPLGAWGREHKARLEARPLTDEAAAGAAAPRPRPAASGPRSGFP